MCVVLGRCFISCVLHIQQGKVIRLEDDDKLNAKGISHYFFADCSTVEGLGMCVV